MPMFSATVGPDTVELLPYNPARVSLVIHNTSLVTVYLSNDPLNVLENGFPVDPNIAVSFSITDGDEPQWQWWARTQAGTATLRIYEGFRR